MLLLLLCGTCNVAVNCLAGDPSSWFTRICFVATCRYLKGAPERSKLATALDMEQHDSGLLYGSDGFNTQLGGITRCVSTQYAMTRYFCGRDLANLGE